MAKKFKVNKDACVGCGACTAIAPDVFALGDDGLAEAVKVADDAEVEACEDALNSCPVGAIEEE